MVRAQDAIDIYQNLSAHDIDVWLVGGWGVDALLGKQTREHKDLDIVMLVDDVVQMRGLLGRAGFGLMKLWSENRWVADSSGIKIPTAFVLHDSEGREVDAHAMRLDDEGDGVPAWADEAFVFKKEDLAGKGVIGDIPVRCITPEMQVLAHTGYELPREQLRDLELLYGEFGLKPASEHTQSPLTQT
jgi:lincosamide nucleotidyltransferase A/C/D/E